MPGLGISLGISAGGGGGGGGGIANPASVDAAKTGAVAQLRSSLKGALTWSKLSGASTIAISAAGVLSLSGALGAGGSASAVVRVQNTTNDAVERSITIRAAAVTPAPAPAPTPSGAQEWLAGDQLSWPTDLSAATTADNTCMVTAIVMEGHPWVSTGPSFCFHNYYRSSSTAAENVSPSSYSYENVYIELPDGTRKQVFFGGSPSLSFTGGTGKFAWNDVDPSIVIPANTSYRVVYSISAPVGSQLLAKGKPVVPASQHSTPQGGDVFATGSASFADSVASGNLPATLPPGTFIMGAPCLATLTGVNDGRDVALVTWDSLGRYHMMYAGYAAGNMRGNFGYGYALADPTNGRIPYGCLSVSSSGPLNLSASGFAARKAMLAAKGYPFNKILNGMGGNSLRSAWKSDFDNMWAFLGTLTNGSPKPIVQATVPPRPDMTTSSGGTTLSGQTAEVNSLRDAVNEYILSLPSGISAYWDLNRVTEEAAGVRGKMPVPGFTTTLAAPAAVGATVIVLNAAPQPGDFLAVGVGLSSCENVFVTTVTSNGDGTFNVGLQNAGQYTGGIKTARAAGVTVGGQASIDGTHYSKQQMVGVLAPALVSIKVNGRLIGKTTPAPTVALSDAQSKPEGNSGTTAFAYVITRSTSVGAVNVSWALGYGTADASDFDAGQATSGVVTIADGSTTGTITILVKGDTSPEADEAFSVSISTPWGYITGAVMSASGTILNDDTSSAAPTVPATNLRLRYPFYDTSKLYKDSGRTQQVAADGDAIQSVTDTGSAGDAPLSGNATYRANAANGKGGAQFNGTSDALVAATSAIAAIFSGTDVPYTVHWLEKVTATPTATAAPWAVSGTGFSRFSASTSNNYSHGKRNNSGSSQSVITDTSHNPAIGSGNVWSVVHKGASVDIWKNGVLVKSGTIVAGATSLARLILGSSMVTGSTTLERFWPGIILDFLVYTGVQAEADIQSVHAYGKNFLGTA
ncbi:hypothetical protein [Sphingomonas sp. SAFR-052]|uniref:hypothetical protein n=1 Tax=Sphingomonas sp. SAFR-052 TaxID=3436867 RepID=UPI003F7CE304